MDLVVDEELFAIETISSRTQFLMNKPPERYSNPVMHPVSDDRNNDVDMELFNKRRYTVYSDDEKTRFFHLFFSKCLSASVAARQLGIHIRAAQRWVKRYYEDPESIFEKKKKSGRRRILGEEHKQFILRCIDENPSAVLTEVVGGLMQNFVDLNVSRSTVYNFMTTQCNLSIKQAQFHSVERNSEEKIQQRYVWVQKWQQTDMDFTTNCVFLDESAFHINLKRGMAWSKKGTPAIVTVPMTKAKATSILGAISATGLINVSLRVPKCIKKRKLGHETDVYSTGTVTGHYLSFVKATLDEMDRYPEMKGHYLVMDNAPIHSSTDIGKYINSRGYQYVYLPPYSPELNPIEQFWSVVKRKVKRNKFLEKESLMTRISEACDSLYLSDFKGFVSHSVKCFDKCLNKEKL
jgi:transposase